MHLGAVLGQAVAARCRMELLFLLQCSYLQERRGSLAGRLQPPAAEEEALAGFLLSWARLKLCSPSL